MMKQDHTDSFFRFYGDVDGNGMVDNTDLAAFNAAYGSKAGQAAFHWFLYDGNGKIDNVDRKVFMARFGKRI